MRLTTLKLKNFRGYRGETVVGFDDLTAFVGKNDVGKSTILEALDIFFNDKNSAAKIEKGDINKQSQQDEILISVSRLVLVNSLNVSLLIQVTRPHSPLNIFLTSLQS